MTRTSSLPFEKEEKVLSEGLAKHIDLDGLTIRHCLHIAEFVKAVDDLNHLICDYGYRVVASDNTISVYMTEDERPAMTLPLTGYCASGPTPRSPGRR
jgi:hypothetical protein